MLIAGKYLIEKEIGSGAFGKTYEAKCIKDNTRVAIKLEKNDTKFPQLRHEASVYKLVQGPGIPKTYWYGTIPDYNVLVMELLGPNLDDLLVYCKGRFTVPTVAMLGLQMVSLVEYLHSSDFIHRDIKPENFLIGVNNSMNSLYMIDFGLTRRYRDKTTRQHIPFLGGKSLTGTMRYASVNTHLGIEQSRRDDLESLIYVLIYLLKGELPWQGYNVSTRQEKLEHIMECKMSTPVTQLCQGLPKEFVAMLCYVRSMEFEDKPNYEYLSQLLNDMLAPYSSRILAFDWLTVKSGLVGEEEHKVPIESQDSLNSSILQSEDNESCIPEERKDSKQIDMVPCFKATATKLRFKRGRRFSCSSNHSNTTEKQSPFAHVIEICGIKRCIKQRPSRSVILRIPVKLQSP